jgi:NTP pyrophosphatase (non-canonical NTP hydrolase)
VSDERSRQDAKWGEQNHDPAMYLTILMEEVGEAAQAALALRFGKPTDAAHAHYREELVQVAAVAVAMIECLDRGKWRWAQDALAAPPAPAAEARGYQRGIEAAAKAATEEAERIKHTSDKDGLGMGDWAAEGACHRLATALRALLPAAPPPAGPEAP